MHDPDWSDPPRPLARPPASCAGCRLRRLPCFEPASAHEVADIEATRSGVRRLPAQRMVYVEGDPFSEAYTLFDGWVLRSKILDNGRRQVLDVLLPGDTFGVSPYPDAALDHTAETVTEVALCAFPHDKLLELFRSQPKYDWRLSWILASERQMLFEHLANVGRRGAFERVGFFLLEIYARLEARNATVGGECEFPLRQEDVADLTALSLETVNRQLARMSREGLARVSHGRLRLLDRPMLARSCDFQDQFLIPKPLL